MTGEEKWTVSSAHEWWLCISYDINKQYTSIKIYQVIKVHY